ncbi:LSU ribosomal protein L24p (L26e) [Liberibacter crescens BT-1]|uniref:Large ribosomal subunit protein uL24 n=1 Tax=Liberibacter crescens (strain BT-1) TaxID=1215343 RepID=L0EUS1_LIBCB|nr:50S ribosomal protein L24 [Liberibacter crescens]AGA64413.1 LSU ribosomal protein L24p (L26e) [Liberibacter crescens BT-1]AMC12596.1 50S ribosomal protein L24 [Liberibacter crescens]
MEKIRTGDKVIVLAGRDKGKVGEVLKVILSKRRAVVRGINIVSCYEKQTANKQAGIFLKEAPIHLSNIAIINKDGKPIRIGFSFVNGKKIRVAKRSGDFIDV